MSGERVTMKDIAQRVGVSINTVHKALNGKPGVSDAVRERIVSCAKEMGYQRNVAASNLSRKDARILVCLPSPSKEGSFYFSYLWKGIDRRKQETRDMGVTFSDMPYQIGDLAACLRNALFGLRSGNRFDGLVSYVPADGECAGLLAEIEREGVAVELVDGDYPLGGRLGAVVANYAAAGRILAEQAANLLPVVTPDGGSPDVLLLAGDPGVESHAEVARAFREALAESLPDACVHELLGAHREVESLRDQLSRELASAHRPQLACSVFAVGSEVLADAIMEQGLVGKVRALGSDVFPESVEALRRGVFANVVYKDPIGLAYQAASTMSDFLLWGTRPQPEVYRGPVELVFRSNLDQYCRLVGMEA